MNLRAGAVVVLLALAAVPAAAADPPRVQEAPAAGAAAPKPAPQGVAVVGVGSAREDAFVVARAVYGSGLRPRGLDELRARILAGDPAPPSATKETRELAELRASIHGEDAASRRLLSAVGELLHVQALLVVSRAEPAADPGDAGAEPEGRDAVARLYLVEIGEFDAARYTPDRTPDAAAPWRGTVSSISARFPAPPQAAPVVAATTPARLPPPAEEKKPFYLSPWLWGAIGGALLLGGLFFFASRDNSDDPIQLRMTVPR